MVTLIFIAMAFTFCNLAWNLRIKDDTVSWCNMFRLEKSFLDLVKSAGVIGANICCNKARIAIPSLRSMVKRKGFMSFER